MKKLLLLLLCLFSAIINSFAQRQIRDSYNIDLGNSFAGEIMFYRNGNYEISISKRILNTTEITLLSVGSYAVKNNQITLLDFHIGFKMLCKYKSKSELQFLQGFSFFRHLTLEECGASYEPKEIQTNYSPIQIRKARKNYKQSHPAKYSLYYTQYINDDYVLDIQKESKYVLSFRGIVLLNGTWKRDGNELLLFDNSLQHTFVVLIGKEGLIGKYLPGNFNELILYKKGEPVKKKISTIHAWVRECGFPVSESESKEPFSHVEEPPQFPNGGEKAMQKYITTHTRYPEEARKAGIKGRVAIRCVIEKDGAVGLVTVMINLSPECDEEAIRVVKSMPKWIPGKQNGKAVAAWYILPVNFGE